MSFKTAYLCGPTLYSDIHLGNLRSMVLFDVLKRANPDMVYARNVTDLDSKIFERCGHEDPHEWVMRETYPAFRKVQDDLHMLQPDHEPFATRYVPQMLNNIEQLLDQYPEHVHEVDDGITIDPRGFEGYGEISNRTISRASNPDNAAWYLLKKVDPEKHFSYDSWIGPVIPGWHHECVSMILDIFGTDGIDLHGGGLDLEFPHHESENLEYKALCGCGSRLGNRRFVDTWLHVAMVKMNGQKMAKSTGNMMLVKDVLKDWSPEVIRGLLLSTNPSKAIDVTTQKLKEIEKTMSRGKLDPLIENYSTRQIEQINKFNFRAASMMQ